MEQQEKFQPEEPKLGYVFVRILIYVLVFMFLSAIFSIPVMIWVGVYETSVYTLPQYAALQTSILFAAFLPALFMLKYFDHRPFKELGLGIKGRGKDILLGMLAAGVLYGVGFGISLALGAVEIVGLDVNVINLAGSFGVCLLVALTEEIMVRGYILGRLLQTKMNKFISLGISSVIFSLMHMFNPNTAFLPMLNLFLAGCLLGVAFVYKRNLLFTNSLHLFWNWFQGPVLGYKVSGISLCPSFVKLKLPEDTIINGGAFGFEGSVICTALMILMTVGIIWYFEKADRLRHS